MIQPATECSRKDDGEMTMTRTTSYTTWGPVRGDCGHHHTTQETAFACIQRDQRGCRSQGGYSDRALRLLEPDNLDAYDGTRGPGAPCPA